MLSKVGLVSAVLIGLGLLGACEPDKSCTSDGICGRGLICQQGTCVPGCRKNEDCGEGDLCFQERCGKKICEAGSTQPCYTGAQETRGKGLCQEGVQYCVDEGLAWSACERQVLPQLERCDKADNNCDGATDEKLNCACIPGSRRSCYQGPVGTLERGLCRAGTQYCGKDNAWGPCVGQTRPSPEVCDGSDNNCNGKIDEYIRCDCEPGAIRKCQKEGKGICQGGQQACTTERKWQPCQPAQLPSLEEDKGCNGKDDDCDGQTDERSDDGSPLLQSCYPAGREKEYLTAHSKCRQGTQRCEAGKWSPCTGAVEPDADETCNNQIDDDCDGQVDEGCSKATCQVGVGRICIPQVPNPGCVPGGPNGPTCKGICKPGKQYCTTQGVWGPCLGGIVAQPRNCLNNQDNDCDGDIDKSCPCKPTCKAHQRCVNGVCLELSTEPKSEPRPEPPRPEPPKPEPRSEASTEPQADAGPPEVPLETRPEPRALPENAVCTPGQSRGCFGPPRPKVGVCAQIGSQSCNSQGQWDACQGYGVARPEKCDGLDNNCDGRVDEFGEILKIAPACALQAGECKGAKKPCDSQNKRFSACNASVYSAYSSAYSSTETCDGKDNDCNGKVDDAASGCSWFFQSSAPGNPPNHFPSAGRAIARDSSGNTYVAGVFSTEIKLGQITHKGSQENAVYVLKLGPTGQVLWSASGTTPSGVSPGQEVKAIDVNSKGEVFIAGSFHDSATFGTLTLKASGAAATGQEGFIAKLSAAGTWSWALTIGGPKPGSAFQDIDVIYALRSYESGGKQYLYIGGQSSNSFRLGNQIISPQDPVVSNYFARLDVTPLPGSAMQVKWAKEAKDASTFSSGALALDSSGNLYATGALRPYTTANMQKTGIEIDGTFYTLANLSSGGGTVFLLKFDAATGAVTGPGFGGLGTSEAKALVLDPTRSAIWVTGATEGSPMGGPSVSFGSYTLPPLPSGGLGGKHLFVAKASLTTLQFATGRAYFDAKALRSEGKALAVDKNGNPVVAGVFDGPMRLSSTVVLGPSRGADDIFVARFMQSDLSPLGTLHAGASKADSAEGLALDPSTGHLYVTGGFKEKVLFQQHQATGYTGLLGEGSLFVWQIKSPKP